MNAANITPEQRAAMAPIIPEAYTIRATAIAAGLNPATELALHFDMPTEHAETANQLLANGEL